MPARSRSPPEPPRPETLARTMRRWHDGTDMGIVWQVVIFLGGIIPALLSVTGLIIWWRARKARRRRAGGAEAGRCLDSSEREWRPEPESNRRARICSPLRNHSAIGPEART